jgi:hypothetical protein
VGGMTSGSRPSAAAREGEGRRGALGRKPAGPRQAEGGEVAGGERLGSTAGLRRIGLEINNGPEVGRGKKS